MEGSKSFENYVGRMLLVEGMETGRPMFEVQNIGQKAYSAHDQKPVASANLAIQS